MRTPHRMTRFAALAVLATLLFTVLAVPAASADDSQKPSRKPMRSVHADHALGLATGLHLGAYGEHHYTFVDGNGGDYADVHRFVIGLGYSFADWIRFGSELEVEHSYVKGGQGELVLEQFLVDFMLDKRFNVRVGKVLVPMSLLNQYHEPPVFHGVERPFVDQAIVPSTWSADGIGVFGTLGRGLRYQAYVINGLDASGFSASSGLRGGRMKERPGLSDPAFTGRLDLTLPSRRGGLLRQPRVGVAGYTGGADNGNRDGAPGLDVSVSMVSADLAFGLGRRVDVRSFVALGTIDNADLLGGVGEQVFGFLGEGAVDVLPASMKRGKLEQAELAFFGRYEIYDTQFSMPDGVDADPLYTRNAFTVGVTFLPVPKLAVKADYQFLGNDADSDAADPADVLNLGVGWMF